MESEAAARGQKRRAEDDGSDGKHNWSTPDLNETKRHLETVVHSAVSTTTAAVPAACLTNLSSDWSYYDQVILAPMVRVGTLPMRLLAASYGATMCYSEEIVDRSIMRCRRVVNDENGTIDFVDHTKRVIFQTIPNERVVFQIGSADAVSALKGAEVIANDVRAVDLNMGCPQHFSLSGGMGAALLKKPEVVRDILTTLVRNLSIPVTCKIRLLHDPHDTIQLAKLIESTGVRALAIHGRHVEDRPRHVALTDDVAIVADAVNLPVIYNGDIFRYSDIEPLKKRSHANSVMIARGAMWNPSVFRPEEKGGFIPLIDAATQYLETARKYRNTWGNTKYCLMEMLKEHVGNCPSYQQLIRSTTSYDDIDELLRGIATDPRATRPFVAPQIKIEERRARKPRLSDAASGPDPSRPLASTIDSAVGVRADDSEVPMRQTAAMQVDSDARSTAV